jgi:hypothetical protein
VALVLLLEDLIALPQRRVVEIASDVRIATKRNEMMVLRVLGLKVNERIGDAVYTSLQTAMWESRRRCAPSRLCATPAAIRDVQERRPPFLRTPPRVG